MRYPVDFPRQELVNLANYLRGNQPVVDIACALECSWWVMGYGLSFIPHDHPPMMAGMTAAAAADILASAAAYHGDDAATAVPWSIIIPIIVDLIRRWLERG